MLASRLETARVSVGREVQAPFRLEGPSDSKRSALQQRIPDALQCSQRVLIDASEVTMTSRQRICRSGDVWPALIIPSARRATRHPLPLHWAAASISASRRHAHA